MALLHLIRHGQASFGAEEYDALSPRGHDQARHLAHILPQPDHLICGAMRRHVETVAPFGAASIDPRWDEFDHLDVIAAYRPDLASVAALRRAVTDAPNPRRAFQNIYEAATRRWASGHHDSDHRETRCAFCARVRDALADVGAKLGKSDTAYAVTSGGPIAAMVQVALGLSEDATRGIEKTLVNCGVTTVSVRPGALQLISLNEHLHLGAIDANLITFR